MEHRIDPSLFEEEQFKELANFIKNKSHPALVDSDGKRTELPQPIFAMLLDVVKEIERGRSIVMMPEDETFTTQAAANFLGVSRQHLVNLLEENKMDFHYVGTHRRIKFKDLRAYKEKRDGKRREGLNKLFQEVSGAGKYDTSYTGNDN